jgi:hypothetical protein
MRQRFVKSALGDVNHRGQPLAGIKQDYTQDLLIEKLHVDAGAINGVPAVKNSRTSMLTLGNGEH